MESIGFRDNNPSSYDDHNDIDEHEISTVKRGRQYQSYRQCKGRFPERRSQSHDATWKNRSLDDFYVTRSNRYEKYFDFEDKSFKNTYFDYENKLDKNNLLIDVGNKKYTSKNFSSVPTMEEYTETTYPKRQDSPVSTASCCMGNYCII